ncbi:triacylglycerol lipase [Aquabacterium sp. CECT 9606]|uniref:esterase/lipase family protein n=1 Tax=Aquabacterium sp. CECT 9606 TaxID=2845822 RepID=UPI001E533356|nr:triacylglycerol lipase [Aquabacterium sp. CECT 9606]CAH0351693.1 Triacylglycerol lipase [Aquabacterium sp. CECT 9606]
MSHRLQRLAALSLAALSIALAAPMGAQAATTVASKEAQTRYPIVLVHGLMGFDSILGVDYWYQITDALRKSGATVLVAKVSAVNDNDVRGEQLLQQLKSWQAAKGYSKFNLIGHSQGGPTARYAAGVAPGLVASVTSVGSPHVIDTSLPPDGIMQLLSTQPGLFSSAGALIDWLSGSDKLPQDPAALAAWASDTAAFNARFPAGAPTQPCGQGPELASNGIHYYSATGNQAKTNAWDPLDGILKETTVPSDGLVTVCATHWGKVLRDDYPWNHLDEVNQTFGLIGKGAPDPVAFYVQQAARLKLKGL